MTRQSMSGDSPDSQEKKVNVLIKHKIMAESYSINFEKFALGVCKNYTAYGKSVIKDGTVYQFWSFYLWIKK